MKKQLNILSSKITTVILLLLLGLVDGMSQIQVIPPGTVDISLPYSGLSSNKGVSALELSKDGGIIIGEGQAFLSATAPFISKIGGNPFSPYIDGFVYSVKEQLDGKVIVGGAFYVSSSPTNYYNLIRYNANGSIDNTFNVGGNINGNVNTIVIQKDGKIIIGGDFTYVNFIAKNGIARLNSDGTLDNSFNIGSGITGGGVNTIALQPDGKVLVGGSFTHFNNVIHNRIVRLNVDGTIDNSFVSGTGVIGSVVKTIAIQNDNRIIIGGDFLSYNNIPQNSIARLNVDGTIDINFSRSFGILSGTINSIAIQNNGKILVSGNFGFFNGVASSPIVRLNMDGSIDNTFITGSIFSGGSLIDAIKIQSDGKILLGGYFYINSGGYSNQNIVRLYADTVLKYYNTIQGNIFSDSNGDCQNQSIEKNVKSVLVKAVPGPFYGFSDDFGNYKILVDTGSISYTLDQGINSLNSKFLENLCTPSYTVNLSGSENEVCCFNFANSIKQIPILNINVQNSRMRRCFRDNSIVRYCNYGIISATNAQVKIEYPPYLVPISSVPMWTSKSGSILIYDIGVISPISCGSISIVDSVVCGDESIRGLTQCIKATISSSTPPEVNPLWNKSSIKVTGSCINDSASFIIQNVGSGNMTGSHEYRVYVNDTLIYTGTFKLNSNEQFIVKYPAEGNTIRLEADQHPLHPGKSRPRATVENCGIATPGPNVKGLVTTAPLDVLDEETATTCSIIRDSYDPNDKQTIPSGIGQTNQVVPGEVLEYTIRFQNTGTDTAYTIVVVDTIDTNLDPVTFMEGVSSHPYTLNISGKGQAVLTFSFYNANLPDSTTNKSESNGLVSYKITVPNSTPLGTVIKNKAYIYFDYNSPILTNETMHTIGVTVEEDLSKGSKVQVGAVTTGIQYKYNRTSVKLFPNPTTGFVTLEMPNSEINMEMRIYSTIGVLQKSIVLENSTSQEVSLESIKTGMYLYEIWQKGERMAGGMLQVK